MLYCEQSRYQLNALNSQLTSGTLHYCGQQNEKKNILIHIITSKQFSKGVLLKYRLPTLSAFQSITDPPMFEKPRERKRERERGKLLRVGAAEIYGITP